MLLTSRLRLRAFPERTPIPSGVLIVGTAKQYGLCSIIYLRLFRYGLPQSAMPEQRKHTSRAAETARSTRSTRQAHVEQQVYTAQPTRAAQPRRATQPRRAERSAGTARPSNAAQSTRTEQSRHTARPTHRKAAVASSLARWRQRGIAACSVLLVVGAVVGLLFFARPTVSAIEKRTLTPFPAFSVEALLDGTFFTNLSLWYADTYPLREPMVAANQALGNAKGIQPSTQMIGGNTQADTLPIESMGASGTSADANTTTSDAAPSAPAPIAREVVEVPTERVQQADIQSSIMSGLYVEGGAAYSMYYFYQEAADTYIAAVNKLTESLGGDATVYSMLIPNNSGAMLDEDTLLQLGATDQDLAIRWFYSNMDPRVQTVETYDALRAHNDEYLYFRTDHHWTQLGAYYAYEQFCALKGIESTDIDDHDMVEYAPFLGSFYGQLGLPAMADWPDTVYAYYPLGTNDLTYWDEDGNEYEGHVIADASWYGDNSKYLCFIEGDRALIRIGNPTMSDGSSCLIVKDSYGNALVPWLVDHYETVWVMDIRKLSGSIPDFVREHDIQDVIVFDNMTIATVLSTAEGLYAYAN